MNLVLLTLTLFAGMLALHALADYPLQGDFLARAKSARAPFPGVPWQWAMAAHVSIHGLGVWIATGLPLLGLLEAVAHFLIDDAKCRGRISFATDQTLHVACKAAWAVVAVAVLA